MISIFARGIAMGAADIVPGVSGGTVAFITGIYFRLLQAINAIPVAIIRNLFRGQFRLFWHAIDGHFLVCLLAGILTSVMILASVISYALVQYPVMLWSFFFGLILASVWHVGRQVIHYRLVLFVPLIIGISVAWWITTLPVSAVTPSGAIFFGAGALAICAMILPGISGSFILVIIGMYAPVLAAIKTMDVGVLLFFVSGCVIGLLSVARLITWAFNHFHDLVLVVLTGFMIGALYKVWPWKHILSWRTNSVGEQVPLAEISVSPFSYAELTGHDPQTLVACAVAAVGFGVVLLIEWVNYRHQKQVKPPRS